MKTTHAGTVATLADNPYLRAAAVFITVVAGVVSIYHLVNYQIPLAKLNLQNAQAGAKPFGSRIT